MTRYLVSFELLKLILSQVTPDFGTVLEVTVLVLVTKFRGNNVYGWHYISYDKDGLISVVYMYPMQTHVKILFKLWVIVCVHPERQTESWFEIDLAGNAPTPIFAWICWPPCCSSSEEKLIATSELDSSLFPWRTFLSCGHTFVLSSDQNDHKSS